MAVSGPDIQLRKTEGIIQSLSDKIDSEVEDPGFLGLFVGQKKREHPILQHFQRDVNDLKSAIRELNNAILNKQNEIDHDKKFIDDRVKNISDSFDQRLEHEKSMFQRELKMGKDQYDALIQRHNQEAESKANNLIEEYSQKSWMTGKKRVDDVITKGIMLSYLRDILPILRNANANPQYFTVNHKVEDHSTHNNTENNEGATRTGPITITDSSALTTLAHVAVPLANAASSVTRIFSANHG